MSEVEKATYDPEVDPVATYSRRIKPNREFYDRVIATGTEGTRRLVYEDVLEPHTGNAFFVKAGGVVRMEQRPSLHNGRTQIADVLFVTPDLEQISDHLNNSALEGFHPRVYGGVWSQSGFMEKLATLIVDEFPYDRLGEDNANHIFFAAHCNPDWIMLAHGNAFADFNSCHTNFIQGFNRIPAVHAIEDEAERRARVQALADRNDVNIFQPNVIEPDEDGVTRGRMIPAPAVPDGTGIEWYAEKDLYVVMSNCPYADQALPLPDAEPNPMYILVYDTGFAPEANDLGLVKGSEWEELIYGQFRSGSKDISPRLPEDFTQPA